MKGAGARNACPSEKVAGKRGVVRSLHMLRDDPKDEKPKSKAHPNAEFGQDKKFRRFFLRIIIPSRFFIAKRENKKDDFAGIEEEDFNN
jgi:hypothetical protein